MPSSSPPEAHDRDRAPRNGFSQRLRRRAALHQRARQQGELAEGAPRPSGQDLGEADHGVVEFRFRGGAAGVVEAVGDQVTYVQPGDHVITCLSVFCGHCENCLSGRPSICE